MSNLNPTLWDKITGRTRIAEVRRRKYGEPEFLKGELPQINLVPSNINKRPYWSTWSTENAVTNGYAASVFVYACVTKLMKAAASVPWVVKQKVGDSYEPAPDHPIAKIFRSPNNFSTFQNQIETITSHLFLGGNAVVLKVRVAGKPAELWVIRPDYIAPVYDSTNYLTGYIYKIDGQKQFIPYQDIIHFLFVDPATPWWGISPMKAAMKVVDTDIESVKFNKVSLQNRGVPDGIISFNKPLAQDQYDNARENIRESYLGSDNAHTPLVLSGEAKWQKTSQTHVELDFTGSQTWTAERICTVFGVPPAIIGINMTTALANISTARLMFWLDSVVPYLDDLKDSLNHGLASEWGTDGEVLIDYDLSQVQALFKLFMDKVDTGKGLFAMGVPFNEINQRLGLGFDEIPGGDQGWISSTTQPADTIADDFEPKD